MRTKLTNAIHNLVVTSAVLAVFALSAGHAMGQIDDLPSKIESLAGPEKREKVQLENGRYNMVEKNHNGQVISVLEYAPIDGKPDVVRKVKESWVSGIANGGTSITVMVVNYEDDPNKVGTVRDASETILRYEAGVLREKVVHKAKNGVLDYNKRTITRYAPGAAPEGVTQREKRIDWETNTWRKVSPFDGTWRLEVGGKQQQGEIKFAEDPGLITIQQDSKVWLLMFKSQTDRRTVIVPAVSNDHLGFARKFIQLRGDADSGRLEFFLTPDETTMDFKPTTYALVREDN